jgi:hypothetical protein
MQQGVTNHENDWYCWTIREKMVMHRYAMKEVVVAVAPVSKTGGWGFESLHSCQLFQGFCASPREQR